MAIKQSNLRIVLALRLHVCIIRTETSLTAPGFRFGLPDLNDGSPWSEMDERDLKAAMEHGSTIDEAAGHLCRSGTVDAVAQKATQLGLVTGSMEVT